MTTRPIAPASAPALAVGGLASILGPRCSPIPARPRHPPRTPLLCIVCGETGGTDVLLNLLLFTPMAIGLRLLGWSWRRVLPVAALLSLTVELLQFSVVAGRDASLSDLLANTVGAAAAAALAPLIPGLVAPDPTRARRLFPFARALFLAVLALSALGYRARRAPGALWSACTPFPPAIGAWTGTRAFGGAQPGHSPVRPETDRRGGDPRGAAARAKPRSDRRPVGHPSRLRAPVHAVRVPQPRLLVLAQDGAAAALSAPTASQRLRLFHLSLRAAECFSPRPRGSRSDSQAGRMAGGMWISSSYSGRRRSVELTLSPSFGWSTLVWWRLQPGPQFASLTALWLGGLIFPAGVLGRVIGPADGGPGRRRRGSGRRPRRCSPASPAIPRPTGRNGLGGALGAALGWALHRFAAYLQSRCGSPSIGAYSSS